MDPLRLLEYPRWVKVALYRQLARLEAKEMRELAVVAMLPHFEQRDRQRLLDRLEGLLPADRRPAEPVSSSEPVEVDPARAAEWLRSIGAEVQTG